ncbi:MAG: class I SAM-dependent methyltransferase [Rhizomicrobium sp.]
MSEHNAYFDEAYFERGWERGTAYADYSRAAENSKTFVEIAEAISFIFKPRRVLEVGCATGATVRHLNALGIETHGIDVSEWAIKHRLHENVLLAGVEALPFSDAEFDLVFSSHSLEHIPAELAGVAFAEMTRVAKSDGYQFHMLPIIGTYPYDYDHDAARKELRNDPTHNLLQPMSWWLDKWRVHGWNPVPMGVHFLNDAGPAELSSGQYVLSRRASNSDVINRSLDWNRRIHRDLFLDRAARVYRAARPVTVSPSLVGLGTTVSQTERYWSDVERLFQPAVSLADATIHMTVEYIAESPDWMRIALIDDSDPQERGVMECLIEAKPGVWSLQVDVADFRVSSGKPDISEINKFLMGGELENASLTVAATASFPDGRILQII